MGAQSTSFSTAILFLFELGLRGDFTLLTLVAVITLAAEILILRVVSYHACIGKSGLLSILILLLLAP